MVRDKIIRLYKTVTMIIGSRNKSKEENTVDNNMKSIESKRDVFGYLPEDYDEHGMPKDVDRWDVFEV